MTLLGRESSFFAGLAENVRALLGGAPAAAGSSTRKVAIIGHRGAPHDAVENTVLGCRLAIEQGADGVEVDLCVTRDGVVVLCHDRDPGRGIAPSRQAASAGSAHTRHFPADLRRPLTEVDWSQLDGSGIGIDTLEQFWSWAKGEVRAEWLMLDVKLAAHEVGFVTALLEQLSGLVLAHSALSGRKLRLLTPVLEIYRALESALPHQRSLEFCEIVADFERGGVVDVARQIGARHVAIGITGARPWSLSRRDVAAALAARKAGSIESVVVWTANDRGVLREVAAWGVDAALTDYVPRAREAVGY